jgi:hypothetical protein
MRRLTLCGTGGLIIRRLKIALVWLTVGAVIGAPVALAIASMAAQPAPRYPAD